MTSSRQTHIPIEHVKAELATFPLASEAALNLSTTRLCPQLSRNTAPLWRQAEQMLVTSFPGSSVDEAIAIRDHLWFSPNTGQAIPLHQYLKKLAFEFLQPQGFTAIPRLPPCLFPNGMDDRNHKPLARQTWWWLSVALPPDFLLAALHGSGQQPVQVETISPLLTQQLNDRGYAETHLHMGAAIDFRTLWTSATIAIANPNFKTDAFVSPSALLNEGEQLAPWLIRGVIIRYILAAYLRNRQDESYQDLNSFITTDIRKSLSELGVGGCSYTLLIDIISELQQGSIKNNNFVNLQHLYRDFTRISALSFDSLEQLEDADPIAQLFSKHQRAHVPTDIYYIHKALVYLEQSAKQDPLFESLFWQTIRIQALLHRHTVQRPLTRGLQWFIRFYNRSSPCRQPLTPNVYLESALKLCGEGKGLKSLEIRTSPTRDNSAALIFFKNLSRLFAQKQAEAEHNNQPSIELCVVLHFTKHRGGKNDRGTSAAHNQETHADPQSIDINPQGFRFSSFFLDKQREALTLTWLLTNYPDVLQILRGLDVCTDELGIPNWVLAPLITELREFSCVTSNSLRLLTGLEVPPLRMTAHAGEDFIHLLTGLRYIDQAIDVYKLTQGDRLGHCLALGTDPAGWATTIGRVAIPLEERLFDLLWIWEKHGATQWWQGGHISMEHQLTELIHRLFKETEVQSDSSTNTVELPDKFQLIQLVKDLSDSSRHAEIGFPTGATEPNLSSKRNRFLYQYLTSYQVFKNGQELIWIDPELESQLITNIQNELRKKIGTLGLTVEVNPSSNQLIGDFSDLKSHPLWRLFPPIPIDDVPPVSICIGSDDPVVFASDLRQEYQRVHDALIVAGLSEQQAESWLNRVRENGLNSRFSLPVNQLKQFPNRSN